MSGAADKQTGVLHLLGKILKIVFFPFLFMVNPKIYLPVDDEESDDRSSKEG